MTFAAKYEILEAVTVGAVETFVARRIGTDERVLVYIFEAGEQPPNQPTVQWILQSFRLVAPDPCGLVMETGRYDVTSYGYLVTKLPEKSALQSWVQSYEARQQMETEKAASPSTAPPQETVKPVFDSLPASELPTRFFGADKPEEITRAFEALRSELRSLSTANQPPSGLSGEQPGPSAVSPQFHSTGFESSFTAQPNTPGDFTRQFFPDPESHGEKTPAPYSMRPGDMRADRGLSNPRSPDAGSEHQLAANDASTDSSAEILRKIVFPTAEAVASSSGPIDLPQPTSVPSGLATNAGGAGTGEFTKVFRGPFGRDRLAETPDLSAPAAREAEEVGDFTRLFGHAKGDSSDRLTPVPIARRDATPAPESGSSFTKLFENTDISRKLASAYDLRSNFTDVEDSSGRPPVATNKTSPVPIFGPTRILGDTPAPTTPFRESKPPSSADLPLSFHAESDGATRAFSINAREPLSGSSDLPAPPSDYTRIISGGQRNLGSSQEQSSSAGPDSSGSLGAAPPFLMPAAPSPQFPQFGGQPQAPPPPQIPAIPVAKVPPVALQAPKVAGTPWTLILILNVLFVLAVLLVLFFVFRH